MADQPAYERRLVAFIDILGFRAMVAETAENGEAAARLLGQLVDLLEYILEDARPSQYMSYRLTHFSDSFVISAPCEDRSDVALFSVVIVGIIQSFLYNGILIRGGVTIGQLLHTEKVLLGPAMVRAYDLESKVARFPRVVIDECVITALEGVMGEEDARFAFFSSTDDDGWKYVDYIGRWHKPFYLMPSYLVAIRKIIEGMPSDVQSIADKRGWLKGKYNKVASQFSLEALRCRIDNKIEEMEGPWRLLEQDYDGIIADAAMVVPVV